MGKFLILVMLFCMILTPTVFPQNSCQPVPSRTVTFKKTLYHGDYTEYFTNAKTKMDADTKLLLKPWSYYVFVK